MNIPEGWKLVPVEPTLEMCKAAPALPAIKMNDPLAFDKNWPSYAYQNRIRYIAMLAAAPAASVDAGEGGQNEQAWADLRASGGVFAQERHEFLRSKLRKAMSDAWNEICSDTGHHPLDIEHQGRKLFFEPRHWADATANLLFDRLFLIAATRAPLDETRRGEWQDISTAPKDGSGIILWGSRWFQLLVGKWHLRNWIHHPGDHVFTYKPTHWMPLPAAPALAPRSNRERE